MRQFSPVRVLAALLATIGLSLLAGCGGASTNTSTIVAKILLFPTTISMNEGDVTGLSVTAQNSTGGTTAADFTFTSSNTSVATVSTAGSICAGQWDSSFVVCTPTIGQAGVGQVTITVASGNVNTTSTVFVHLKVDRVDVNPISGCTTMGQDVSVTASAYSTSAPGCSTSSPCDITSTVGPINFASNDTTIAATSSGIDPAFSSTTNTPTYTSGGTFSGSSGQTCTLSNFNGVTGATATVTLTGKDTIAGGTHLTITAEGSGGLLPPTTATLGNGSATCSGTANVRTALISNGGLTAEQPGSTTVFASVSGLNSVAVPYLTCPVAVIMVHGINTSDTTFTMNKTNIQGLAADVFDINGQAITPSLTWGSSALATASVVTGTTGSTSGTITAANGGTAYITATCSYPDCNRNVGAQYSLNLVTANVTGGVATTIYAGSLNSTTLVPISTTTNTVGTAINLPHLPNSMIADPAGTTLYVGSSSGLMAINVATSAVSTYNVNGTIQAISPDGKYLLISDSVANNIYYFSVQSLSVPFTQFGNTTNSSAYTPDSKYNEWLDGSMLAASFPTSFIEATTLPYTSNAMDISGPGGLTYITSSGGQLVDVRATCDQTSVQSPPLAANQPTLIKAIPNGSGAVAADSPAIDVITTSAVSPGCPPLTTNSIASFDMGVGPFTAQQMFVSSDSSDAWIITDLPKLLFFELANSTPHIIPLAGQAIAYSGGVTADNASVYLGTSDGTVHRIDVASNSDAQQIAVNLKDPNGASVVPGLVYVLP